MEAPSKMEIFKQFYGTIGDTYQEGEWLTHLGVFSLGWDMALKYCVTASTEGKGKEGEARG